MKNAVKKEDARPFKVADNILMRVIDSVTGEKALTESKSTIIEAYKNTEINNLTPLEIPKKSEEISSSGRVDINILLDRARKEKEKETRINLVFGGLIVCLIFVAGLILSF